MSKCSASWAIVRSPLTAARATFALKAGEWFRRGRLLMVSPVHGDYRRCQAEIPLIVLFRFPGPALILQKYVSLGGFIPVFRQKLRDEIRALLLGKFWSFFEVHLKCD